MVTDPASLDSKAVATSFLSSLNPKTARRLHEPFVSPEFGASAGQGSPRLCGSIDGNGRGRPSVVLRTTGDASDQAAPLYTVNAGRAARDGALIARPSPLTESLLLGKRMSPADVDRLSVGGSASGPALVPVGLKGVQFQPKPDKVPPPYASSGPIETSGTMAPPLRSPQDLSPLVTDAVCTWGQELGTVLGQAVLEAAPPAPRKGACCSSIRAGLITTGLFPQKMTLRYARVFGCIALRLSLAYIAYASLMVVFLKVTTCILHTISHMSSFSALFQVF